MSSNPYFQAIQKLVNVTARVSIRMKDPRPLTDNERKGIAAMTSDALAEAERVGILFEGEDNDKL